jgi:ParB family chromosome partitioning protein
MRAEVPRKKEGEEIMSSKSEAIVTGPQGRQDMQKYDPEVLEIVTDKTDALYDERINMPLDPTFIANVAHYGIIEPVVCAKRGVREDGSPRIVVVAGRQRVRAAREANKNLREKGEQIVLVPCVMRRAEDGVLAEIAVSENEQRRDDTPIAKARKMQRLLDLGRSMADVCMAFGCAKQNVTVHLKLLETDASVQKALASGKVSLQAVRDEVLNPKLTHEQQAAKIPEIIAGHKPTVSGKLRRTSAAKAKGKPAKKSAPGMAQPKGLGRREVEWIAKGFAIAAGKATVPAATPETANAVRCILDYILSGDATKLPKAWVELAAVAHHKAKAGADAEPGSGRAAAE